ncbi:hypothetical protein HU200_017044 [Digitaria exilis]|uniref:Uncharacterized protein n=1 Tax=Digitaria exilis TaxID=1010633 RepID=A0A835F794_9POAL|nr:hypothetical protein HU200_017044 [Digitaria exilis]
MNLAIQRAKTINHLLAGCVFARQFWHGILSLFGLQEITPLAGELDFFTWWKQATDRLPYALQQGFNTLTRNNRVFNNVEPRVNRTLILAQEEVEFWMLAGAKGLSALVAIRLPG